MPNAQVICHFKTEVNKVLLIARVPEGMGWVLSIGEFTYKNQEEWNAAFSIVESGNGTLKFLRTEEGFQLIGELNGQEFSEFFNNRGVSTNTTLKIEPIVKNGKIGSHFLWAII